MRKLNKTTVFDGLNSHTLQCIRNGLLLIF